MRARAIVWAAASAAAVLLLALVGDRLYASRGLDATYHISPKPGRRVVVAQTVEHRTRFPSDHRPLSRVVQAYDFETYGVPSQPPPLDVELAGTLTVPEGPQLFVATRTKNHAVVRVDGGPEGGPLPPGEHAIEVKWTGPLTTHGASLELLWGTTGDVEQMGVIPNLAFRPLTPLPGMRLALWICALLLAAAVGALVWGAVKTEQQPARLRRFGQLATMLLLLLCLFTRTWDYDVVPDFRENFDELYATWNGWSILMEGRSRGWTLWPGRYGRRVERDDIRYWDPRPAGVVSPYFEHPPLFHVMVGAAAVIGGADQHWSHARLEHTRLVPIVLGAIALMLVIAVGRRLWPDSSAPWFAGLVYAALPLIAVQGRVIKEEALVAVLALATALFFLRWRDDGMRHRDLYGAAICAGLAPLAKLPGLTIIVALLIMVASTGGMRSAVRAGIVAVGIASLILVYGAVQDFGLFWETSVHQGTFRGTHWNILTRFVDSPKINHSWIGRGWLIALWLALATTVAEGNRRTREVLTVIPILYILGIAVSSGAWTFGWYIFPAYPFLCLGMGRFLERTWERPSLLRGFVVVGILTMYTLNFSADLGWLRTAQNWPIIRREVNIFLLLAFGPFLAVAAWPRPFRPLARLALIGCLVTVTVLSCRYVVAYEELADSFKDFDRER